MTTRGYSVTEADSSDPEMKRVLVAGSEVPAMHERAREFKDRTANQYGFDVDVHEFDEGTKTAEDAADVIGCDVAQIASGLVFTADGQPVMVITSGANRVNEEYLADELGVGTVEMADPETVRETTGYGIGGVPPFAHETSIETYIDESLLSHDEVWAAAGTPQTVFPIDPDLLVEFADATPVPVAP